MSGADATVRPGQERRTLIAGLMLFEAATLALASTLHLSSIDHGSKPFSSSGAGIAEALIGLVLVVGAGALIRAGARGRRAALAALAFAIVGFIVGLTFTLRGGDAADLAYHATMLPVLVATTVLLARD